MRFGLSLPHYGFSLPSGETSFEAVAGWAKRAEALGFDSVWVSDHFFYSFARYGADPAPIASLEPLTTLAGIASVTDRVRLGTLVLCAPFRHPALLARVASSIDLLSGGRLDLGVGAGWLEEEFDAFGFPFGTVGERFAALEESLEVLQLLFRGEPVAYEGSNVTLRDAVLAPAPDRPPPMWVGGKGGPRLLRAAARFADGWNTVWRVTPEGYADKVADVRAACEAVERDPSGFGLSIGLYSLIGEDEGRRRPRSSVAAPPPPGTRWPPTTTGPGERTRCPERPSRSSSASPRSSRSASASSSCRPGCSRSRSTNPIRWSCSRSA
jgi:probable F420-dependent oxidoreductase